MDAGALLDPWPEVCPLPSWKGNVVPHLLRAAALLAALAVTACAKDASDLTNPNSPGGADPGGTDPSGGNPPPSNPIVPVDPSAYTASVLGSFTNTGTSYGLLFRSSGSGRIQRRDLYRRPRERHGRDLGLYNGDLISALQDPGVEVVACNGTAGCDLITLYSPAGG
jgi:hypothetical protein